MYWSGRRWQVCTILFIFQASYQRGAHWLLINSVETLHLICMDPNYSDTDISIHPLVKPTDPSAVKPTKLLVCSELNELSSTDLFLTGVTDSRGRKQTWFSLCSSMNEEEEERWRGMEMEICVIFLCNDREAFSSRVEAFEPLRIVGRRRPEGPWQRSCLCCLYVCNLGCSCRWLSHQSWRLT